MSYNGVVTDARSIDIISTAAVSGLAQYRTRLNAWICCFAPGARTDIESASLTGVRLPASPAARKTGRPWADVLPLTPADIAASRSWGYARARVTLKAARFRA